MDKQEGINLFSDMMNIIFSPQYNPYLRDLESRIKKTEESLLKIETQFNHILAKELE